MTDREKLLKLLKHYKVDSMNAILNCYFDIYYNDYSATQINNLVNDLNCILKYKLNDLEKARHVAYERAIYLKSYLNGDMWSTEEDAKKNIQPQIDNAQAIIEICNDR